MISPMPSFLVIDPDGRLRTADGPLTVAAIARAIRAATITRVDLDPAAGLAGFVDAVGLRGGSDPNAVGSCLLGCLGDAGLRVHAGPVAVVGWDRTRHDLPDGARLRGLTRGTVVLLTHTAEQIVDALDGFDTRNLGGCVTEETVAWDRAVREHGRRVRAAFVTGVDG
jgi:hypothetical protein